MSTISATAPCRSIFFTTAARLVLAAAALTVAACPALARLQQAPSSRIVLELPDGFEPAVLFSGFTNEAQGVSYVVVEMPEKAFEELAAGMTPEALAAKGVENARREQLGRTDSYLYMQAEQTSPAGRFGKFFVVTLFSRKTTKNLPKRPAGDVCSACM